MRRRVKKFFKTPKGLLTIILAIFTVDGRAGPGHPRRGGRVWAARSIAAGLVDAAHPSGEEEGLGVSERRGAHRHDCGHGAAGAGAVVRDHHHLGGRDSQQVRFPLADGERVQSGGAGDYRQLLRLPHRPELVGRADRS